MEPEIAARLAAVRALIDQAGDIEQVRETLRMMCDIIEEITENVEYLNEGADGELVSFH